MKIGRYILSLLLAVMIVLPLFGEQKRQEVTTTEGYEFFVGWLLNGGSQPGVDGNLRIQLQASSRDANKIVVEKSDGNEEFTISAGNSVLINVNPNAAYIDNGVKDETESCVLKGVRVYSKTNKPFSLFSSNKNGLTSEGSADFDVVQVVPIEGLGKEYIVHTHNTDVIANQFIVVGTEKDTEVRINLSVESKKHAAGDIPKFKIGAREVYLVTTLDQNTDFSGSTVCASKPVAVFVGHASVQIPNEGGLSDDHAYEQILPLDKWGKHFLVPMTAGQTKQNMLEITACSDGTLVTITGHTTQHALQLDRGRVWRISMNNTVCPGNAVYVEATKPVATFLYTTSAGKNTYPDPVTGEDVGIGDPSSTWVPPLEHLTDTTIFTTYNNPDPGASLNYYLNLWAPTDSIGTIKLDGNAIASSLFKTITGKTNYSFARFPISKGTHTITSSGKSFTGFTYGYSPGEMSLYTVGYDFIQQKDSLFVNDDEAKDVRYAEYQENNHRYYLEVNHKNNGDEFLDSIYICDQTTLTFPAVIGSSYSKVGWEVEPTKVNPNREGSYFIPIEQSATADNKHEFQHQFKLLPATKDKNREPYEDFELRLLVYHSQMLCGDAMPDTLKALVRVLRQFNDTTWRIVCKGDTVHFFNDNYNHNETDRKRFTVFKFRDTDDLAHDTVAFHLGDNEEAASVIKKQYSRHYLTQSGCDSTVTLKLYVCDTYYKRIDTTMCQRQVTNNTFHILDENGVPYKDESGKERFTYADVKADMKSNSTLLNEMRQTDTIMPIKKLYRNIISSKKCQNEPAMQPFLDNKAKYEGCPDTIDLYLTVMPQVFNPISVNVTEWCTKGDDHATWTTWMRADGHRVNEIIKQDDPRFNDEGYGIFVKKYYYNDADCAGCPEGGCVMEYDSLVLHIAKDVKHVVHICQNKDTTYIFGGTGNNQVKGIFRGWEYTGDKLYPNIAVDSTRKITIGNSPIPEENCVYESRMILYVHPAYVEDSHLHTRKEYKDTTCINVLKGWKGKDAGHLVWSETHKQRVDASQLPVDEEGTFIFIDSLKTKTCTECKPQGCDSIERLTLIVGEEKHQTKELRLCRNQIVDFEWKGTKHYYYGKLYDGPEVTLDNATLIGDEYLNKNCNDDKWWEYTFTGETRYHCDSTWTVRIHLDSTYVKTETFHICTNEPYKFLDEAPVTLAAKDEPYKFEAVVKSQCQCDSGVTHYVYVHPTYNQTEPADTTCQVTTQGASWMWDNHLPGHLIWMVNADRQTRKQVMSNMIPIDVPGTYTLIDSLKTKTCTDCRNGVGCDSIISKSLTIIPSYHNTYDRQLSSEGYWLWDDTLFIGSSSVIVPPGVTYSEKIQVEGLQCFTHTQHHTTIDARGKSVGTYRCDSIVTWCIKVGQVYRDTTYAPVCVNCDYVWHMVDHNTFATKDTVITQNIPGVGETVEHSAHYLTVMGYDSIYTLFLTGFPTKYNHETADVCQGETYSWAGHPGQRNSLYIIENGEARETSKSDFEKQISQAYGTYLIRDSMVTDTIFYNKKTNKYEQVHCDSIWELTLTVHPTYSSKYNTITNDRSMCSNETLLWEHRLFVGYDYDEAAHPIAPAAGTTAYDSVLYITRPMTTDNGRLFFDSIRPTADGTVFGCDSVRFVNIHISPYKFNEIVNHIGDNNTTWSFGGKPTSTLPLVTREDLVPTSSVQYDDPDRHEVKKFMFIDTLRTADGCDSIVWDSVYIHPSYRFTFDTLLCSNNDWSWRIYPHINEKHSGIYYDSLKIEPFGIDSIFVLNLTIQPGAKHRFGADICKNDTLIWDTEKIYYREHYSEIEHKYTTGSDCDSILILNPVFFEYYHFAGEKLSNINGYSSDSICRFDTIIWISEGETTPHTEALRGENGEIFDHVPTDTVGWITIYDSLHTTAPCHCDSTYTLRYYVKPSYRFYDTLTICSSDTIEWRNQTLYSDTATTIWTQDSYQTLGGSCDSIYYLTLYVNQAYDSTRYDTICGNEGKFIWEGHDLTSWMQLHEEDTLPRDTFLFTNYPTQGLEYEGEACDSVFRLYLNVRPILSEEWYDTICVSETYYLNDKSFTTTGVYTDTIMNSFGCDSFAIVHLAVVPPTKYIFEPLTVCADQNGFDIVFTYDDQKGFEPRTVGIIYDSLAQACGFPKDSVVLTVQRGTGDGGHDDDDDNPGGIDDGGFGGGGIDDGSGFDGGGGFISFSKHGQATMHIEIDMPQTGQKYLRPNVYSARIYFENGTCDDPELQRVDFLFTVNYPEWIMEQHWMDAIGILNENYNDGYTFSAYQWYKNGKELVGETKSYLFAPDYLEAGTEYSVLLTRADDSVSLFTCPLVVEARNNTMTPTLPYVSVVPTYVIKANPVVYILSSQYGGEYKLYNPYGSLIQSGRFEPGEHNSFPVTLPTLSGIYLFELNQEKGEHRTVKVIVN